MRVRPQLTVVSCGCFKRLQCRKGGERTDVFRRESKVAGSNITPFKDVGGQDSLLSSHRGGEEPPKECIGRTRSKTVTLLLGAKVMGATSRDIGNQNGRAHANLVMGATARAAGRDKGKENVTHKAITWTQTRLLAVTSTFRESRKIASCARCVLPAGFTPLRLRPNQ